ncbi:hypothetical protein WJX81_004436 [Elliptochloris bilobata]|uniref:NmrA-like domain-containing protein n=1 Tax=Elliptochloris bilobata TaxID=381761 RepID=A0AAW1QYA6_9CHLO
MPSAICALDAFKGAAGAFIVTDFFAAGLSAETETQQGVNAVDAAKEAGVGHVVFSTLEDVRKYVPKGAIPELSHAPGRVVAHFESKDAVMEHMKALGVPWTALLTCVYMDNFATRWQYQRQPDGTRTWSDNIGSKPMATHAVADIGGSAAVVFADPGKYAGNVIPVVREHLSWPHAAEVITEVTGISVKYVQMSDEQFKTLPFQFAEDCGNMFRYYRDFDTYDKLRPVEETIFRGPSFREWAVDNREALLAALNE